MAENKYYAVFVGRGDDTDYIVCSVGGARVAFRKHSMPKIPFHTSLEQYIRQHGCPRCSHHLEDLGSPELESHVTIEELLFQRMKIAGSEKDLEEAACSWYEDYR
ncbi:hypothetical protein N7450_009578 [Penicillium hetheringtonii]|uniref:Uncharacterized protein n=1 Tax=Penicillium hetheringtonii TaxID=911720 RepID=A0AAD6DBG7_9EURO|nr:hypothetical protein N7450_009578 [Penicillium hetheringtonii]